MRENAKDYLYHGCVCVFVGGGRKKHMNLKKIFSKGHGYHLSH